MKATAIAPSNIAFIKYMGRKDDVLRLPENASISLSLSNLLTTTTVEFSDQYDVDRVTLNGEQEDGESERVIAHLNRIRSIANINLKARVVSNNNFPTGTGLSSSASGFAALTVAGAKAAGLELSEKELSILARQGSGSACRSIPGGFVEWYDGNTSDESFAETIFPSRHWGLVDLVAIVSKERKTVSTSITHGKVKDSKLYPARIEGMNKKIERCRKIIKQKDFHTLGTLMEQEALEMHAIFMSAGIIHLTPESLALIKAIRDARTSLNLAMYFTINTGQDVHVLCESQNVQEVQKWLESIEYVQKTIQNTAGEGTKLSDEHLF